MRTTYSGLMQSKYFNPAFNSAIFDGPVRIYFAQFHESLALKIYFQLQQRFSDLMTRSKSLHQKNGRNILVMLYPNSDTFQMSFEGQDGFIISDELDEDTLIGINGPFEDDQLAKVLQAIQTALQAWERLPVDVQATL
ncbi:MAG: hypothetical protein BroJett040_07300 [Oligoflexia bacterium]|nr:MAG: hypothetical protein BroJett040_07300 [Oligoflexia bacterium]